MYLCTSNSRLNSVHHNRHWILNDFYKLYNFRGTCKTCSVFLLVFEFRVISDVSWELLYEGQEDRLLEGAGTLIKHLGRVDCLTHKHNQVKVGGWECLKCRFKRFNRCHKELNTYLEVWNSSCIIHVTTCICQILPYSCIQFEMNAL